MAIFCPALEALGRILGRFAKMGFGRASALRPAPPQLSRKAHGPAKLCPITPMKHAELFPFGDPPGIGANLHINGLKNRPRQTPIIAWIE